MVDDDIACSVVRECGLPDIPSFLSNVRSVLLLLLLAAPSLATSREHICWDWVRTVPAARHQAGWLRLHNLGGIP